MPTPVLQIILKQWDKGERSEADALRRAAMPDRYSLVFPPARYALNRTFIIDCHGYDRLGNRLQFRQIAPETIRLDRFEIDLRRKQLRYSGNDDPPRVLGDLHRQWIQSRYQWRYSVRQGGMIYWLYEEVILNAAIVDDPNRDIFLSQEPGLVIENLETNEPAGNGPA